MSKEHDKLDRQEEQNESNRKQNISFGMERLYPQLNLSRWTDPFRMKANIGMNPYAKRSVSQPGDPAEVQADKVADAVVSGNVEASQLEMENSVSGEIMAKASDVSLDLPQEFEEQLQQMKGGGMPLPDDKRENLEEHLDADLDRVRMHTGPQAQKLSESINARAFTEGQDIFFADDHNDEELLAHEVTHTLQDDNAIRRTIDQPGSVRIIENMIDPIGPVTGNKNLVSDNVKTVWQNDKQEWDDKKLLDTLFSKTVGPSLSKKAEMEDVKTLTEEDLKKLSDATRDTELMRLSYRLAEAKVEDFKERYADVEAMRKKTADIYEQLIRAEELLPDFIKSSAFRKRDITYSRKGMPQTDTIDNVMLVTVPLLQSELDLLLQEINDGKDVKKDFTELCKVFGDVLFNVFQTCSALADDYLKILNQLTGEDITLSRRKAYAEKHPNALQKLITLVIDHMDIDLDAANIFTVHYDERVDDMLPDADIPAHISEAAGAKKTKELLTKGGLHVGGVILFESGDLKVVKLNIHAFDSLGEMEMLLEKATKATGTGKGQKTKKSKKQKELPDYDNLIAANKALFRHNYSVRIIQDVIGVPKITGEFDKPTIDRLLSWQEHTATGVIRAKDIERIHYTLLGVQSYNAAIALVVDYYDLVAKALALTQEKYQYPGSDEGYVPQTPDELFYALFYKEDPLGNDLKNDPDEDLEAGITIGDPRTPTPSAIQIALKAFKEGGGALRDVAALVNILAHEFVHARQFAGGKTAPEGAEELYPYLFTMQGGLPDTPQETDVMDYIHGFSQGVKYYFEMTKATDLYQYKPVMEQYIQTIQTAYSFLDIRDEEIRDNISKAFDINKLSTAGTAKQALKIKELQAALRPALDAIEKANAILTGQVGADQVNELSALLEKFQLGEKDEVVFLSEFATQMGYSAFLSGEVEELKKVQKHIRKGLRAVRDEVLGKIGSSDFLKLPGMEEARNRLQQTLDEKEEK